ncbi:MAG: dephospho-CoA kinase [Gemmatimonadota bacterium]
MTRVVGLTGNVASGKSTVAALLRGWGATIVDADLIVRELQRPGQPVFEAILERFGPSVRRADGGLDRTALRRQIVADPAARQDLERIVHPAVEARRQALVATARERGDPVVISDIPLLFEAVDPGQFDAIIVVDAPIPYRPARLVHDRGLSPADADALIAAQVPAEAKRARATWVIDNDSDRPTLEARTRAVWEAIRRSAA